MVDHMTTAKTLYKMSFPSTLSRMTMFVHFYNVTFSAVLENKAKIAGIGLANSVICIFAFYFFLGFLEPLNTLTS